MSTSRRSGWWECYRGEVEKHWQSNMKWDWIPFSSFLLHTYKLHRSHRFSFFLFIPSGSSCTTYVHPFRTYRHIGRTINDYLESWTMCTSIGVRSLSVGISLWTYLGTTPYRVLINQTVTWLAKHPFTPKYQSSFSGRRRHYFSQENVCQNLISSPEWFWLLSRRPLTTRGAERFEAVKCKW